MPKKKKKSNYYFTQEVEDAIVAYNNSEDSKYKNKIYEEKIYPAFCKLAENIINMGKFTYINMPYEDTHTQLVSFITHKMDRYDPNRAKAYSFFTRISRNHMIVLNKKGYKNRVEEEDVWAIDQDRDVIGEVYHEDIKESLSDFIDFWVDEMSEKVDKMFRNDIDVSIADSILELFRRRELLVSHNKKSLYVLIRERSGLSSNKTSKITRIVRILRNDFYKKYNLYSS